MIKNGFVGLVLACILMASSPAIAVDFVLEIYGNADMNEFLDEDDIQYIKGIIEGTNEKTKFADANYDGNVDEQDIEQLRAILDGRETQITYIDILGEAETLNKPIKRLVNMGYNGVEMTRILGAEDLLVAYGADRSAHKKYLPELSSLPSVSPDEGAQAENADFERIIMLQPDALQTNIERASSTTAGRAQKDIFKKNLPDVPLISLNMRELDVLVKNVRTYGYLIDHEREAEEFIKWYTEYYDLFESRTKDIPEEERPTAVFEYASQPYNCYASGSNLGQVLLLAGGKNIIDGAVGPDDPLYKGMITTDAEFIVKENPEYIFEAVASWGDGGYETDDLSKMIASRDHLLNRSVLANVDAVKDEQVYCLDYSLLIGAGNNIIGTAYLAKLFYPDLFQDVDPEAIHQEYVDRFCRIDFDVKEQGAFLYPPYNRWPVGA